MRHKIKARSGFHSLGDLYEDPHFNQRKFVEDLKTANVSVFAYIDHASLYKVFGGENEFVEEIFNQTLEVYQSRVFDALMMDQPLKFDFLKTENRYEEPFNEGDVYDTKSIKFTALLIRETDAKIYLGTSKARVNTFDVAADWRTIKLSDGRNININHDQALVLRELYRSGEEYLSTETLRQIPNLQMIGCRDGNFDFFNVFKKDSKARMLVESDPQDRGFYRCSALLRGLKAKYELTKSKGPTRP